MTFCSKIPLFNNLGISIQEEVLNKSINELLLLFLACHYNKEYHVIEIDNMEIDDRNWFQGSKLLC